MSETIFYDEGTEIDEVDEELAMIDDDEEHEEEEEEEEEDEGFNSR